jgi:anionic cell wall polymer biosynthesis LytR-Cps2A-Psr (LCP) family protein
MQHLNGVQAVAYSRIRYVGNNDYERTQRQRSVLSSLINTVSSGDKTELMKNAVEILKLTDHDLSMTDIVKLAGMYFSARDYTLIKDRVPYDDLYYSQNEMLVPSQPATNERLLGEIYATEKADES